MPIDVEALLQPIPGEDPSGADLRYDALTDQIKEARRRDDDLNQGVWQREIKTADYGLVIKLATEALEKRSKDLQIAGWLAEALVRREGIPGLRQGLELIRKLLEVFWDTIYPRIDDDGDLELRATPLRWVGSQLDSAVRSTPLTQAGHHWYQYRESRTLPTEAEAQSDSAKQQRRNDAAAEGILTPEEFEKGLEGTSLGVSQKIFDHLTELLQDVQDFGAYCDEKFGDASPDFVPLRTSIEEVLQTARVLLVKKGGLRSQAQTEAEALPELPQAGESPEMGVGTQPFPDGSAPAAAAPRRARGGIEPVDFDDAVERTIAVSRFLRREFPFSPAPYLMLRALRWGELRASGGYPDPNSLEPPPSEVRIELKRLANEGNWNELRERAEEAAGQPCGRSWLDLQRYAVNACRYCGVDAAAPGDPVGTEGPARRFSADAAVDTG